MTHIVKRRGHKENFDERKTYASVYSACLITHLDREKAEDVASKVTQEIKEWIKTKEEITSNELFKKIAEELEKLNKEASFMYLTHRDVS